jgi:hypothetical protein
MNQHENLLQFETFERQLKRKRDAFIEDYAIQGRPALLWQCWPSDELSVDVTSKPLSDALQAGAGLISDNGWWNGFEAQAFPSLVFDGIASSRLLNAGWAFQVHVDGSMIAGIWNFPDVPAGDESRQLLLPPFYAEAFRDFAYVVTKCYDAVAYKGASALTCTMEGADKLALAGARDNIVAEPVKRKTLRWPLVPVSDKAAIDAACASMAAQLMRAYGKNFRSWAAHH